MALFLAGFFLNINSKRILESSMIIDLLDVKYGSSFKPMFNEII